MSESKEEYSDWFNNLYDTQLFSGEELTVIYEEVRYKGFERTEVLAELHHKFPNAKEIAKLVIGCAIMGPVRAFEKLTINGRGLQQLGIHRQKKPGDKGLTCSRITAATADLAAFYLKKLDVPKRVDCDCPAWLQFPSAASIIMPAHLRNEHKEFSIKFSEIIGGEFNDTIYRNQVINAYYDEDLNLF
jgi:hypothetical protein